jgi:hypothetical protein
MASGASAITEATKASAPCRVPSCYSASAGERGKSYAFGMGMAYDTTPRMTPRTKSSESFMKKGGIEISFTNFRAEDGRVVERIVEDYKSAEAARIGLEKECKQSSRISEDGYRTDAQGERVGRRVLRERRL